MNIMGIHISTVASQRKNLFANVDSVLSAQGMGAGQQYVPQTIQQMAAIHALRKMLNEEKHFSVCTITDLEKVCQGHVASHRKALYNSVHCIAWADMEPDFRQTLVAMVLDDFRHILTYDRNETMKDRDADGNMIIK